MRESERILQVFVIKEYRRDGHLEIMSNRELVWTWIERQGLCILSSASPPKQLTSYNALCNAWAKSHLLIVMIYETGKPPVQYQLIKMQVQRR